MWSSSAQLYPHTGWHTIPPSLASQITALRVKPDQVFCINPFRVSQSIKCHHESRYILRISKGGKNKIQILWVNATSPAPTSTRGLAWRNTFKSEGWCASSSRCRRWRARGTAGKSLFLSPRRGWWLSENDRFRLLQVCLQLLVFVANSLHGCNFFTRLLHHFLEQYQRGSSCRGRDVELEDQSMNGTYVNRLNLLLPFDLRFWNSKLV